MMYPRLELLRDLLAEDGSIWVSIDDNEGHYLKVVMDEVFGRGNFVAKVIWRKNYAPKSSARHFSEDHDYILVYVHEWRGTWTPFPMPRTNKQDKAYKNPDNDVRGTWKTSDLSARNPYSLGIYDVRCPVRSRRWTASVSICPRSWWAKFILVRALGDKIRVACRETTAQRGYQELLFGSQAAVETSYVYEFRYDPGIYPANSFCRSGYKWQRHFYPVPGDLEVKGEEFGCAQALDLLPAVKRWVRNLERQPERLLLAAHRHRPVLPRLCRGVDRWPAAGGGVQGRARPPRRLTRRRNA